MGIHISCSILVFRLIYFWKYRQISKVNSHELRKMGLELWMESEVNKIRKYCCGLCFNAVLSHLWALEELKEFFYIYHHKCVKRKHKGDCFTFSVHCNEKLCLIRWWLLKGKYISAIVISRAWPRYICIVCNVNSLTHRNTSMLEVDETTDL